jgi:hypothetical protein
MDEKLAKDLEIFSLSMYLVGSVLFLAGAVAGLAIKVL